MPIYEYRCRDCTALFARLQPVGASTADVRCPECGGGNVERQLSTFAATTGGQSAGSTAGGCGSGGFT
jgi:putative FmdB family regulatory protein